ncbi:MAG: type VI secretion system Vgr family protein [Phycisphaerales bacterium]
MPASQEHRWISLDTPLGEDALLLRSASIHEGMGVPFEISCELLSDSQKIDYSAIIGQNVTLRMEAAGRERFFNGYCAAFTQTMTAGRFARYQMTIVPWLWILTRTSTCRIFQEKTIPEIIDEVFRGRGFTDFQNRLSGEYPAREYVVQYNETDFNFVSRLMEEEGIYYFFEQRDGRHDLILVDSADAHDPVDAPDAIPFSRTGESTEGVIWDWRVEREIQPGAFAHNDFDFKEPRKNLLTSSEHPQDHALAEYEIFEHPGEFVDVSDGERKARIRQEAFGAGFAVFRGQGGALQMKAGYTFKLDPLDPTGFPGRDDVGPYLITAATYELNVSDFEGGTSEEGAMFHCSFVCIDATQPFRAERRAPRPSINGPQTAIVVGKQGEEIWTDEHGRVKVKFHWDRHGPTDENSSCWVRVSQEWAGRKWGSIMLPRIGQEVIVEFLDGDPDRPIITGRVYNGDAPPPYELPKNATMSTRKSLSSKGGDGFNEIRFEDKKGKEQLFLHAQRRHDLRVRGSSYQTVCWELHERVGKHHFRHIEEDQHLMVGKNRYEEIAENYHLTIAGNFGETTGGNRLIDAGDIGLTANTIVLEGLTQVCLKVGGSFITVGPAGIDIKGPMVNINSGGAAGTAPSVTIDPPEEAKAATTADPGELDHIDPSDGPPDPNGESPPPEDEKTWVAFLVLDAAEEAVTEERCIVHKPDGSTEEKKTDGKGYVCLRDADPGMYKIQLPDRHDPEWTFLRVDPSEEAPS